MQVDKIHDVQRHLETVDAGATGGHWPRRIGVVNFRVTRLLSFIVVSLALFACTIICVMAVWDYLGPDYVWRALASLGIISATTAIFVSLNEGFGPFVRS